jgi:hypothetical protein
MNGDMGRADRFPGRIGFFPTNELASVTISGSITTILGKTATFTRGAGREKRVHHSKSLPLLFTGERLFFRLGPGLKTS